MKPKIQQETDEQRQQREDIELIAQNIQKISEAVASLFAGSLNKKALLVLLAHSSGYPQYQIEAILNSASELGKTYLKK